jgi:hypothetical protein
LQAAIVGFFESGQDLQKRGFTGAIAANQADALPAFQSKIGVIKKSDVAKSELGV